MKTRRGWIRSIRKSKSITFCSCADAEGGVDFQITIKDGCEVLGDLKLGASFEAKGKDSETPRGMYEFLCDKVEVIGESDDSFPIQPKEHSDEYLRSIPQTRGRTMRYQAIFKIRSKVALMIRKILDEHGFYEYSTPIITQADCEGAGEAFKVSSDWLDESLTVSGQLHAEVGMMSLGKVFTFGPTFRAEKSDTRKHLAEFWMLEPEVAFWSLDDAMDFCEKLVVETLLDFESFAGERLLSLLGLSLASPSRDKAIIRDLKDGIRPMDFAAAHFKPTGDYDEIKKWPRMRYDEVCEKLGLTWGEDISSEMEKKIIEFQGGLPTFVTHYPKELKPFYMKKEGKYAVCFDLIFPEVGELAGGSEREHRYDVLEKAIEEHGLDKEKMQWYLDTRKWGSVPHAGFGLGFERLLLYITKAEKVHDVIPFPVSY